jgi:aminoglycoside 3-N-acetyltransferase
MHSPAEISEDLRRAGLAENDNLILHSSYKSTGGVPGGPQEIIRAIQDVIGPNGNLMVPTFTYSMPMWNIEPFHRENSKSRTGSIPESVRLHPRALRSFHPTHSVAVIGPDAEEIVRNHLHSTPLGIGSPFHRMYERGAKILMLGTFQDTNSTLHYCEVLAVPYVNVAFSKSQDFEIAWFVNDKEQLEYTQIFEIPGCSRGFRAIEQPLREEGILKDVRIGDAASQIMDMKPLVNSAVNLLKKSPGLLLCHTATCMICPKRRKSLETQV